MVLVGIKTEIGKPRPTVPDEGYLEFFVDWYVKLFSLFFVVFKQDWHITVQLLFELQV